MSRITRRHLVKSIAYAGAAMPLIAPRLMRAAPANGKLDIASIGVGGRGWNDINLVAPGQNIVAICDVDLRKAERMGAPAGIGGAAEKWPDARRYQDWRKLLDESKDIDAVTIAIPDHNHAIVTLAAMALGKHVYCEKPLCHDVWECRQVAEYARKHPRIVTQMGNQNHAKVGYRMLLPLLRGGTIGKIKEAHGWSNNQRWPIFTLRPKHIDPMPSELNWDTWIGTAPMRPFVEEAYHPWAWRGWVDFGSALQGDMGCHIFDPVVWSMELGAPSSIRVETAEWKGEAWTAWRISRYEFPGTAHTAEKTFKFTWWDGGHRPPVELAQMAPGRRLPAQGAMFIGTEGVCVIQHEPTVPRFYPEEKFKHVKLPELETIDHGQQWVQACLGNGQAASHFDYSGPLTETVQLGGVAARYPGETLLWDSKNLKFTNKPEADEFLKRKYRKGWEVPATV